MKNFLEEWRNGTFTRKVKLFFGALAVGHAVALLVVFWLWIFTGVDAIGDRVAALGICVVISMFGFMVSTMADDL